MKKGIYLSPEFVEALTDFLKETSEIMREAREEIEKKYPEIRDKSKK